MIHARNQGGAFRVCVIRLVNWSNNKGCQMAMDKKRIDRIIGIKEKFREDKEREIEEERLKVHSVCDEIDRVESDIAVNYGKISLGPMSGNDFAVIRDYLDCLDATKAALISEKESLEENIAMMNLELYQLAREVRMLSKLKENADRIIRKSQNRRQQKLLDELALRIDAKRA